MITQLPNTYQVCIQIIKRFEAYAYLQCLSFRYQLPSL